jgi:hypothetical protein
MSSLVTVANLRDLVQTSMSDVDLQTVIDREEAMLVQRCGAHYEDDSTRVTETLSGSKRNLYLRRKVTSIYRVTEDSIVLSQGDDDFRVWALEGRIERLPAGTTWGSVVSVIYVPYDDNEQRRAVLIELVRLALERTAMRSESVAGEYSYQAPDWQRERARLYRSLNFRAI